MLVSNLLYGQIADTRGMWHLHVVGACKKLSVDMIITDEKQAPAIIDILPQVHTHIYTYIYTVKSLI